MPLACLRHAFLLLPDRGRFLLTVVAVAVAVAADTVDDALAAHLAAFVVLVAVASVTAEAAVPAVAATVAETAVISTQYLHFNALAIIIILGMIGAFWLHLHHGLPHSAMCSLFCRW